MYAYLYLLIAIMAEVVATTALKASEGFTKPLPSFIVICGYLTAFYSLSLTLKWVPIGIAYAIWSGLGIVAISLVGFFLFEQKLDLAALVGMAFIIVGVLIMNLFSNTGAV